MYERSFTRLQRLFAHLLLFSAAALSAACLFPTAAAGQECPSVERHRLSNRVPLIRNMVDPNPIEGDFTLPMPCGGKLILRHVCVPSTGLLGDSRFSAGCADCGRTTAAFMEAKRSMHLAGAFTPSDLSAPWQEKIAAIAADGDGRCPNPEDRPGAALYYFIGKYEISRFQWNAVMDDDCPGWNRLVTEDDPRPVTDISWFEAVQFTRRYTEWLLKEHPDQLPRFADGRFAHLRLPTEAEWEYAARGGHRVSWEELNWEDFFPLAGRPLSDYAVYTAVNAPKPPEQLAWIGSKCANPLGLFDTAGNAAEMMLEPFRLVVGARHHGAAGGFLIKGGSFGMQRNGILPGRREELPYFLDTGAFRRKDVGFRVVLSAIVTPRGRIDPLEAEWARLGSPERSGSAAEQEGIGPSADAVAASVQSALWQTLFSAETVLTYFRRIERLQSRLAELEALSETAVPEVELSSVRRQRKESASALARHQAVMDRYLTAYLSAVDALKKLPAADLDKQMDAIVRAGNARFQDATSIRRRLAVIRQHVDSLPFKPSLSEQNEIVQELVSALTPEQ